MWGERRALEGHTEGKERGRNRRREEEEKKKIEVSKTKSLIRQQPAWRKGTPCLGHETY